MGRFDEIIELFQSVDDAMKGEILLDYAQKIPTPSPDRLASVDIEQHRLHECQTPVFLWVDVVDDKVQIEAVVAEEAPTVRGVLGVILRALDGASPAEVVAMPADLVDRLGLGNMFRMNRAVGLSAMIARIKRDTAAAANSTSQPEISS